MKSISKIYNTFFVSINIIKFLKTLLCFKNWIYIETGSGEAGWIYVFDDYLIDGEPLSYYLDGLNYAG